MLRKKKDLDLITSCDQVANFHFGGLAATFPTVACAELNEVIQGPLAIASGPNNGDRRSEDRRELSGAL